MGFFAYNSYLMKSFVINYPKIILIGFAWFFVLLFLCLPLWVIFQESLSEGFVMYAKMIGHEEAIAAIKLTMLIALIVLPFNIIFGLCASWCIAKFNFFGKSFLLTLIDLPFSISPVVVGLMFSLCLNPHSFLGKFFNACDMQILFALPAMVIVTLFATLPLISKVLIPLMQQQGNYYEEAAISLGARGFKVFWHLTLPNIKWGLLYGILLSNARAIGEFGAVSIVSGNIRGATNTITLEVENLYNDYNITAAFALSSIVSIITIIIIILKCGIERQLWKKQP